MLKETVRIGIEIFATTYMLIQMYKSGRRQFKMWQEKEVDEGRRVLITHLIYTCGGRLIDYFSGEEDCEGIDEVECIFVHIDWSEVKECFEITTWDTDKDTSLAHYYSRKIEIDLKECSNLGNMMIYYKGELLGYFANQVIN